MKKPVYRIPFAFILCFCFSDGGENAVEVSLLLDESKLPVFDLPIPIKFLVVRKCLGIGGY